MKDSRPKLSQAFSFGPVATLKVRQPAVSWPGIQKRAVLIVETIKPLGYFPPVDFRLDRPLRDNLGQHSWVS